MRYHVFARIGLLGTLGCLALAFLGHAAGVIANFAFQFAPSKVSAELPTTLIAFGASIAFGLPALLLFVALLARRPWFLPLYWSSFLVTLALLTWLTSPVSLKYRTSDVVFIGLVVLVPLALGSYLSHFRSVFFSPSRSKRPA